MRPTDLGAISGRNPIKSIGRRARQRLSHSQLPTISPRSKLRCPPRQHSMGPHVAGSAVLLCKRQRLGDGQRGLLPRQNQNTRQHPKPNKILQVLRRSERYSVTASEECVADVDRVAGLLDQIGLKKKLGVYGGNPVLGRLSQQLLL